MNIPFSVTQNVVHPIYHEIGKSAKNNNNNNKRKKYRREYHSWLRPQTHFDLLFLTKKRLKMQKNRNIPKMQKMLVLNYNDSEIVEAKEVKNAQQN